jgi:hypothetical protein
MILDSGTAFYHQKATQSFDTVHTNFATVPIALGRSTVTFQVDCLRNASWQDIEDAVEKANLASVFLPVADEHIVFSNYTQRYEIGALSLVPWD